MLRCQTTDADSSRLGPSTRPGFSCRVASSIPLSPGSTYGFAQAARCSTSALPDSRLPQESGCEVEVRGFGVPAGLDRRAVRLCLESLLARQRDADFSEFDEPVLAEATRIRDALSLAT